MPFIKGQKAVHPFSKGHIPWNKGKKFVIHRCKNCGKVLKRKNPSGLCRRCVGIGRKMSIDTKRRMSIAHKGKVFSDEHKKRLSQSKSGTNNPQFGKKHSEEHKRKIGNAEKGNKHWNWRGGITPTQMKIRNSETYKQWRNEVYGRDNWTCRICGKKCESKDIVAHHLKSFSEHPELRFDVDNGITLCRSCHSKLHHK